MKDFVARKDSDNPKIGEEMDEVFDNSFSSGELERSSDLSSGTSPETVQNQRSEFYDYAKNLFDIFDTERNGYVAIDELELYLNDSADQLSATSNSKNASLIHTLQQICPANGLVNFKRFSLAIQIVLGKRNLDKDKGIGRSLRPRSFLFAVTEVEDGDACIKEKKDLGVQKKLSFSPADSVISSYMDESSERDDGKASPTKVLQQKTDNLINQREKGIIAVEELIVLQKCLLEANKVNEIYQSRIAELEEIIKDNNIMSNPAPFDYSHCALHILKLWKMNEELQTLLIPNQNILTEENFRDLFEPQKKIEELSFHIRQLENEKSVLVKDFFGLRAKFAEVKGKNREHTFF